MAIIFGALLPHGEWTFHPMADMRQAFTCLQGGAEDLFHCSIVGNKPIMHHYRRRGRRQDHKNPSFLFWYSVYPLDGL